MNKALILGGTPEARQLAERLVRTDWGPVVLSRLGLVPACRPAPCVERVGGFGGVAGFRRYVIAEGITRVIDATHPFAAQMTQTAFDVCQSLSLAHAILQRPPWTAQAGDHWIDCPTLDDAADKLTALKSPQRVLLTTGQKGLARFCQNADHDIFARVINRPDATAPNLHILSDRGPFDPQDEEKLLTDLNISLLVTKNAGGPTGKLTAARQKNLPVLMVARPPLPPAVQVFSHPDDVVLE